MSLTQIIEKVNKVKGHFRDDQMTFLYPFVKRLNPKGLLVEIGTYRGKSAKFYSLANPEIKILTIDLVFFKHPRHESEGVYIDEKVLKNGNIFQGSLSSESGNWITSFLSSLTITIITEATWNETGCRRSVICRRRS